MNTDRLMTLALEMARLTDVPGDSAIYHPGHGIKKVIVDESEMQYPDPSLLDVIEIAEFYSETFLPEMKFLKLAVVVHSDIKPIAEFWEFQIKQKGYGFRVFSTMEEAKKFLRQ